MLILRAITVHQTYRERMFDTVWGVPVHVLVTHLVVVIGPLACILAVAYALRPSWRGKVRRPLMIGAVLTGITGLIAGQSGEPLERRVLVAPELTDLAQLKDHTEAGDIAKVLCLAFMVVTVVVVVAIGPGSHERDRRPLLHRTGLTLLTLVAAATLVSLVVTAHLGVHVTWDPLIKGSSSRAATVSE